MYSAEVFIVSGGIGASGEQLARTALAQFADVEVQVTTLPGVRSDDALCRAVERAAAAGGIILHTLVDERLRGLLKAMARERGVVELDAIGPVLDRIAALVGQQPLGAPGRYRTLRADYFRRVEAIEYAVAHDDGRNCHQLNLADIVIVGVSRVGKTPLCMFLAMQGYKAANVPLAVEVEPPAKLFQIDRRKVIGLTLEPERLVEYRRERQQRLGSAAPTRYSELREIARDLEFADELFRRRRFATIDVTSRPVEETASDVVALVGGQRQFAD
jgi:regulator of PEP synthase PpsR (kinase-PPPase family)